MFLVIIVTLLPYNLNAISISTTSQSVHAHYGIARPILFPSRSINVGMPLIHRREANTNISVANARLKDTTWALQNHIPYRSRNISALFGQPVSALNDDEDYDDTGKTLPLHRNNKTNCQSSALVIENEGSPEDTPIDTPLDDGNDSERSDVNWQGEIDSISLTQLLRLLNDLDIRYSPNATKKDLIQLFKSSKVYMGENNHDGKMEFDRTSVSNQSCSDEREYKFTSSHKQTKVQNYRREKERFESQTEKNDGRKGTRGTFRNPEIYQDIKPIPNDREEEEWDGRSLLPLFRKSIEYTTNHVPFLNKKPLRKARKNASKTVTNLKEKMQPIMDRDWNSSIRNTRRKSKVNDDGIWEADWKYVSYKQDTGLENNDEGKHRRRSHPVHGTRRRSRKRRNYRHSTTKSTSIRDESDINQEDSMRYRMRRKSSTIPNNNYAPRRRKDEILSIPIPNKGSMSLNPGEMVEEGEENRDIHVQHDESKANSTHAHKTHDSKCDASNPKDGSNRRVMNRNASSQSRNPTGGYKKIYSPYESNEDLNKLSDLYGEAAARTIDSVGEFIADLADGTALDNNSQYYENFNTKQNVRRNRNGRMKNDEDSKRNGKKVSRGKERYWKDRLSSQLDDALGLNFDSKSNDVNSQDCDRHGGNDDFISEENGDALSIFYGVNVPKRKRRKKVNNVPFWEDERNLLSILFGYPEDDSVFRKDKLSRPLGASNICIAFFSLSLKTTSVMFGRIIRWVSCRGTLPRPIVASILFAAAISAPRGKRVSTVGIALVLTRTIAEAIHSSMRGYEDWDHDECDENSEDEIKSKI